MEAKRCRAVVEKDVFLQNTLLRNVITVKNFFLLHSKVREEVLVYLFHCVSFSFFYSLGFSSDSSHFLPPKHQATVHKDQNKYVTWNPSMDNEIHHMNQYLITTPTTLLGIPQVPLWYLLSLMLFNLKLSFEIHSSMKEYWKPYIS